MIKYLALCGALLLASPAYADLVIRDYVYDVEVVSVYDGDTITVNIDLGFSIWINNKSLRLYGIDAPEVRGASRAQGIVSRDWLRDRIARGETILIESIKDEQDKYGRYLAILYVDCVNVNQQMIDLGLAKVY